MSTSPARRGGWKRLRRVGSAGKAQPPRRREVISLSAEDDVDEEELRHSASQPTGRKGEASRGGEEKRVGVEKEDASSAAGAEEEGDVCSICLSPYTDATRLQSCSHSFCFVCIYRWCMDVRHNSTPPRTHRRPASHHC